MQLGFEMQTAATSLILTSGQFQEQFHGQFWEQFQEQFHTLSWKKFIETFLENFWKN